jgi:hypothetical protein
MSRRIFCPAINHSKAFESFLPDFSKFSPLNILADHHKATCCQAILTSKFCVAAMRIARSVILRFFSQSRFLHASGYSHQSESPNPPKSSSTPTQNGAPSKAEIAQKQHPQAPIATTGFSYWVRHAETGKRLTLEERQEEAKKQYLYTEPPPDGKLPPILLNPPGLPQPPVLGQGQGKETRKWWQRELEIWIGRYNSPFNVQVQLERHRKLYFQSNCTTDLDSNTYYTEWTRKADRRSVRLAHGKV